MWGYLPRRAKIIRATVMSGLCSAQARLPPDQFQLSFSVLWLCGMWERDRCRSGGLWRVPGGSGGSRSRSPAAPPAGPRVKYGAPRRPVRRRAGPADRPGSTGQPTPMPQHVLAQRHRCVSGVLCVDLRVTQRFVVVMDAYWICSGICGQVWDASQLNL